MKTLLTLSFLTISALAASSLGAQAQDWPSKTPFITKSFTGETIGEVRVETSGGNLSLRNLEGAVTAGTSGGSVSAEVINGDLSAHTSGGNVHMSGLSGSLETSTNGGNIDVSMTGMGKFVRIHNSGGNIALEIPKGQGVELNIHGDRVSADFASSAFTGKIDKKRVEGTLNGGGIPITVDGGDGGVQLTLK